MTWHMYANERPICTLESSVEVIGKATRLVGSVVDCSDCLRQMLAESEERSRVLREMLAKTEVAA